MEIPRKLELPCSCSSNGITRSHVPIPALLSREMVIWRSHCQTAPSGRVSVYQPEGVAVDDRNVKVHEREHRWKWTSKEEFVKFVGRNTAPSIQMYMAKWTTRQKEDVVDVIWRILDEEFPGAETFYVPMVANIVEGTKK